MTLDQYGLVASGLAAIVWTLLLVHVVRDGHTVPTHLRRVLVAGSAFLLLWALMARWSTDVGILPDEVTAPLMSAAVSAVFIVGLALLTLRLEQ